MTDMPCCTWYLNSTCENILLLMLGYTHIHTHKIHTCTDLSRALLVLLGYLCYHWVLQKLVRISVTFNSKTGKINNLLITSNITSVFLAPLVCLFFSILSVVLPF